MKFLIILLAICFTFMACDPDKPTPKPEPIEPIELENGVIPSGTTFYWQLQGTIKMDKNVQVYDIDLEDHEKDGIFQQLQAKGIKVICYFSAGTYEAWRSDAGQLPSSVRGGKLSGWDERWLDIRSDIVRNVMMKRIDRAVAAGCDAVEPDNVDGYENNNNLGLTKTDQINYVRWLANYAHQKKISIGLKNALGIIEQGKLYDYFDWALNEQCYEFEECDKLLPFTQRGKAVFIAEYNVNPKCTDAKNKKFTAAKYNEDLNGRVFNPCE